MSHYIIHVPVEVLDVNIIKREFRTFVDEAGGFTVKVTSDNDEVDPSPELSMVLRKLFLQIVVSIDNGDFEGVH